MILNFWVCWDSRCTELYGAARGSALLNGGWLNSGKWQNLHQMIYISVIGELHWISSLYSSWPHFYSVAGKKKKKKTFLRVKFVSRQVCQDAIIVRQPGGKNSNDLVTATWETMSSTALRIPSPPRQNLDPKKKPFKKICEVFCI